MSRTRRVDDGGFDLSRRKTVEPSIFTKPIMLVNGMSALMIELEDRILMVPAPNKIGDRTARKLRQIIREHPTCTIGAVGLDDLSMNFLEKLYLPNGTSNEWCDLPRVGFAPSLERYAMAERLQLLERAALYPAFLPLNAKGIAEKLGTRIASNDLAHAVRVSLERHHMERFTVDLSGLEHDSRAVLNVAVVLRRAIRKDMSLLDRLVIVDTTGLVWEHLTGVQPKVKKKKKNA